MVVQQTVVVEQAMVVDVVRLCHHSWLRMSLVRWLRRSPRLLTRSLMLRLRWLSYFRTLRGRFKSFISRCW